MALLAEELSVKRQILAFLKGFCEKANFGQNSAKIQPKFAFAAKICLFTESLKHA